MTRRIRLTLELRTELELDACCETVRRFLDPSLTIKVGTIIAKELKPRYTPTGNPVGRPKDKNK